MPIRPTKKNLNKNSSLPFELKAPQILSAMDEFVQFLSLINGQLLSKSLPRLEEMLMPANFSSVVGEFMSANIPKYCKTLVKNLYHNGHPDLIPVDCHPGNAVQHCTEGVEIKASRYSRGWQGHNPEETWLMVFIFESNRPTDATKNVESIPFRFLEVLGAQLTKSDWLFAGRSKTSRRTITASVTRTGYEKMSQNWIYREPDCFEE